MGRVVSLQQSPWDDAGSMWSCGLTVTAKEICGGICGRICSVIFSPVHFKEEEKRVGVDGHDDEKANSVVGDVDVHHILHVTPPPAGR